MTLYLLKLLLTSTIPMARNQLGTLHIIHVYTIVLTVMQQLLAKLKHAAPDSHKSFTQHPPEGSAPARTDASKH